MDFLKGFRIQALWLASACALALLLVAGVAYVNMVRLSHLLTRNTEIAFVLRNHQFADMMHDTMRAQVYRAVWAARDHAMEMPAIQKETENYIAQFQAAIDANGQKNVDPATHEAFAQTRELLQAYIQETRNILALAARDVSAAEANLPAYLITFELLEVKLEAITQLLQEQVRANEAEGRQAQRVALAEIALALLLAVFWVFFMLYRAGWRLATTLIVLSGRLQDSQISAELQASEENEIGVLVDAFNTHNQRLRENEERWKFALEGAGDAMWDWDVPALTIRFSIRWWVMMGYGADESREAVSTVEFLETVHPEDVKLVIDEAKAAHGGSPSTYAVEYRSLCKDGSWKWVHLRGMVLSRSPEGQALRMTGTGSDISERKTLEAKIHALAYMDALTGLANRALFADRVHQAIAVAQRESTQLALLYIDLDQFKPVNDSFGHSTGDALLVQVARRIQACIRESDAAGRVGGDEFVVLLRPVESSERAMQVAEKVRQSLQQVFLVQGHSLAISCSIGVALYPEHGLNEDELSRSADAAMYRAKGAGRDNVQLTLVPAGGPSCG